MAADGEYTVTVPNAANDVSTDIDEVRENFEYIRREWMMTGIIPIHNTSIAYTYTSGDLTGITFSGGITGSASFTYDGSGNLTTETWTLYGKTITVTHTYSAGDLIQTDVSIA